MQTLRWTKRRSLKPIYKYLLSMALIAALLSGTFLFSREMSVTGTISAIFFHDSALEQIKNGVALLKTSAPLGDRQVALAVLNTKTGKISEHRIEVSPDGYIVKRDPTLDIRIRWWNAFNSFYEIPDHPELIVVANKYRIERKYLPEQRTLSLAVDAPASPYFDMVYVPYSDFINKPEVVAAGVEYINKRTEQALKELRKSKVESRAIPGKLVADVVPVDLMKTIVLVEHVDPTWLHVADDGGRTLVNRALVIIGANQDWAYRYTNSSAGARGLAQFIKPTYDAMVELYPTAGLIKDHTLGMTDHTNAFKAIALYFDDHLADFPEREMLAAVYNGGPARVGQAVRRNGKQWATSSLLAGETVAYVKKYQKIAELRIF